MTIAYQGQSTAAHITQTTILIAAIVLVVYFGVRYWKGRNGPRL